MTEAQLIHTPKPLKLIRVDQRLAQRVVPDVAVHLIAMNQLGLQAL
jgi:hypothetical protein